jgi:aminoglycoside phosphotransferase (APT) family kinase protein
LPEPDAPAFVHLDAFPGNMLVDDGQIAAVIDFGSVSLAGDRRLDPLAAVAYLTPDITPVATDADREVGREWLAERGLILLYAAARRWIAAYWSAARTDVRLHAWCRSVLL